MRYIREPLVLCRGDNDSFARSGVVRRFQIDIDGYLHLASVLFEDPAVRQAFLAVMKREHPWYVFAELRSRVASAEQWRNFERKLLIYGYGTRKLAIVRVLGSIPAIMFFARIFWFGQWRVRTAVVRAIRPSGKGVRSLDVGRSDHSGS